MNNKRWTALPIFLAMSVAMLVMAIVDLKFSPTVAFIEILVSIVFFVVSLIFVLNFKSYVNSVVKSSESTINEVSDRYIDQIKTPAVVIGENDEIIIFNTIFKKTFFPLKSPVNENITTLLSKKDIDDSLTSANIEVKIDDRYFNVYSRKVSKGTLIDFVEVTKYISYEKELHDTKKSVCLIAFDNAEDFDSDDENEVVKVMVQLEAVLLNWANENSSLYRKTSDSKYLVIMDEVNLQKEIDNKFKILDSVREIESRGKKVTISVGIAHNFKSLKESHINARKALDMALGRGGDQVALLSDGEYSFYGGLSKGIERTNNVKARVLSDSIRKHIENSDCVLVMGHKNSDIDCIGSAIGIYSIVTKSFKKPCHIVVNEEKTLAKTLIDYLREDKDNTKFISPEKAFSYVGNNTLLFVVDTHSPDFVESKELLKECKKIITIDHHRKMVNSIEDSLIFFHNPSGSSTSELVTSLVRNLGDETIEVKEAEALLAGIMLDTKNFIIKTGEGTFEAAAYLKGKGADTVVLREMFSNSIDNYTNKSELVSKAEKYKCFAITIEDQNIENSRVVCAQAADDLLSIQGIYGSFVISRFDDNTINISARSFGKVNVQVIMEKLGGGGHQTMAATQIKNVTFDEAKNQLLDVLKDVEVS